MPYTARTHQLNLSLLYHIFNRGHNRGMIFHDDEDYQFFIHLLADYATIGKLSIYHWVLMPNHYHVVLELDEPTKISSLMAGIGRSYACYHHRKYHSAGTLWQGRFKSQPIQKELYLNACGRYIERNPVKAGVVGMAWDYLYSSAAYYALGKQDCLTVQSPLFDDFGETIESRRQKYQEFLLAFDSDKDTLFENVEFPRGSAEFKKRLLKENGRYSP